MVGGGLLFAADEDGWVVSVVHYIDLCFYLILGWLRRASFLVSIILRID